MKEDIYTAEWFRGHYDCRDEYRALADIVMGRLPAFHTCIDVGCGVGFVIERFQEMGHIVCGIDGASTAQEMAPDTIKEAISVQDLTKLAPAKHYDLVVCTEVAEHMPASDADKLVEVLCAYAKGLIFFTAATPGQGGNDHINEQPHEYWIEKFEKRGYRLDTPLSDSVRFACKERLLGMHWFGKNSMVFR